MRAKQRRFKDRDRRLGVPILIHGDAAFAGQGLVAETLNLSQLPGYRTGGTIHIVVNNQIGFTTAPGEGRSTRYCTDVAKMIEVPIFHVNGEDPEAVVFVGELAVDFRQTFGRDVVIDMVCYRRHGHNEGDEPAFTQPLMYEKIKNRISIRELYTEQLVMAGELYQPARPRRSPRPLPSKLQEVYAEVQQRRLPAAGPPIGSSRARGPGSSPTTRSSRSRPALRTTRCCEITEQAAQVPPGLRGQSQAGADPLGPNPGRGVPGRARLVVRRDAGDRLAALGRHAGPLERAGQPPRHVQPAARRSGRHEDRRALDSASTISRRISPNSASTTVCSPRRPCWASTTATRWTSRTC